MATEFVFDLRREPQGLTVGALIELLREILSGLEKLDPDLPADWEIVRVSVEPLSFVFRNPSANGSITDGIRGLRRIAEWREGSQDFDESQIEGAKEIVGVFAKGVSELRISSPGGGAVTLDSEMARKVKAISDQFETGSHHAWTSVRGNLYQVTVSKRTPTFRLRRQRDGREIRCEFAGDLLDKIRGAFPSRVDAASRVEVHGRARYNQAGEMTSIRVERDEDFRMLPAENRPIDYFAGIDITGGTDSVEYLEALRDGE